MLILLLFRRQSILLLQALTARDGLGATLENAGIGASPHHLVPMQLQRLGATAFGECNCIRRATAIGAFASATGQMQLLLVSVNATGISSLAIGEEAQALGNRSFAFGYQSNASKNDSLALGSGAMANHSSSAALGQNVTTTRSGQVALGSSSAEITIANLATGSSNTDGSQFEMVVANGDGTISGLTMQGVTIDSSNGTFTANSAVVSEGLNAKVISNQSGSVTTYSVSGYNATTTAGPISGATSNSTSNGVTVSSKYNSHNSNH